MENNFLKGLELIDSLKPSDDIETIKKTLIEAYKMSDRLLDATTLLSRFIDNFYQKEKILTDAIKQEYSYLLNEGSLPLDDGMMARQFIRALYELSNLYKDFEKYPLLIKVYEAINDLKSGYPYGINHDLYALYTYFDKDERHNFESIKTSDKLLIDCIYEYERSNYELAKKYRDELVSFCPNIIEILDGNDEIVDEDVSNMLRRYAFYINRITSIIEFIKTGVCR